MSQHSQRTQQGPPLTPIVAGAVFAALSLAGTVYTATGEVTGQEMTGGVLGVLLTSMLIAQTARLASDRSDTRAVRAMAAEAEQRTREMNTGTWTGASLGQVLQVRYDPATGRFHIEGWLSDSWVIRGERMWTDVPLLVQMIGEIEASREMLPGADLATEGVRQRLGLTPVKPEPVLVWPPEEASASWPPVEVPAPVYSQEAAGGRTAAFRTVEGPIGEAGGPPAEVPPADVSPGKPGLDDQSSSMREPYPSALATSDAFGPVDQSPARAFVLYPGAPATVRGGDGRMYRRTA